MKKKIIISVCAVLLTAILLTLFSALLAPKYITNPEGRLTQEYYSQSRGNDVIFLGDCEVYETFVPAILWEERESNPQSQKRVDLQSTRLPITGYLPITLTILFYNCPKESNNLY